MARMLPGKGPAVCPGPPSAPLAVPCFCCCPSVWQSVGASTPAPVPQVLRQCTELEYLYLAGCHNVPPEAILRYKRRCPRLRLCAPAHSPQ